jgi:hypothetical protein
MLGNIALQNKSIMIFLKRERNPSSLKNIANAGGFLFIGGGESGISFK